MAENRFKTQKETDDERKAKLEDEWARKLPCCRCEMSSICRYNMVVKRVDYPQMSSMSM